MKNVKEDCKTCKWHLPFRECNPYNNLDCESNQLNGSIRAGDRE